MLIDSMLLQALSSRPHLRLRIEGDVLIVYNMAGTWEAKATTPYGMVGLIRDGETKFGLDVLAAEPSPTPLTQVKLLKKYLSPGTIEANRDGNLHLQVDPKVVWQLKHILHRVASSA